MSTAQFDTLAVRDGSAEVPVDTVINGSAKAWVNFNGTGTVAIRSAFNVTSITDNGTGDYTINLTNALEDANYSAVVQQTAATSANGGYSAYIHGTIAGGATLKTTTQLRIQTYSSVTSLSDYAEVNAAVFR